MKLHIIFGQRECRYEGQYAPEALGIVDEHCHDENPGYLTAALSKARDNKDFIAVEVVDIELNDAASKAIFNRLNRNLTVQGALKTKPSDIPDFYYVLHKWNDGDPSKVGQFPTEQAMRDWVENHANSFKTHGILKDPVTHTRRANMEQGGTHIYKFSYQNQDKTQAHEVMYLGYRVWNNILKAQLEAQGD